MKKILLVFMLSALAGFGLYKFTNAGGAAAGEADGSGPVATEAPESEVSEPDSAEVGRQLAQAAEHAAPRRQPPAEKGNEPQPTAPAGPRRVALMANAPDSQPAAPRAASVASAPAAAPDAAAPDAAASSLIKDGRAALKANDHVKGWTLLSQAYRSGSEADRKALLPTLRTLSKQIFWNKRSTVGVQIHRVERGDSLARIGAKYGVNYRGVARINGIVRYNLIRIGQKIRVLRGEPEILIRKGHYKLTLFVDDKFVKEYDVGLGRENKTPVGEFELDNLLIKPDWYPSEGGVIKYGDKRNLLGTRWLGFADKPGVTGFGIHGTWEPETIGRMASDGCIRMRNEDVEELYDFCVRGTRVKIVP